MNRKFLTAVALLSLALFSAAQAQRRDDAKKGGKSVAVRVPTATVFLGASLINGGELSERVFDSLAVQPLTARDSLGNPVKVTSFYLTLAERGLFEDSAGNPMVLVDYTREICSGDTLTLFLRNVLAEHTKPGDTVWIDNITASNSAGMQLVGKGMKFVLKR